MMLVSRIIRRVKFIVFGLYEKLSFALSSKRDDNVFFYPHPNGRVDKYDIINYHSDNVLCLVNYLIAHKEYSHLHLFVVIFDSTKIDLYHDYVNSINQVQRIRFINESDTQTLIKYSSKSKYLFTDTGHTFFRYKTKNQLLICLNYFVPFKNDYILEKSYRDKRFKINNIFNFFLMTAPLPARVSACDKGIPLSNFLLLGFCRNDVFYESAPSDVKDYLSRSCNKPVRSFIVYTPTYRDYEEKKEQVYRDVFGYDGSEYPALEEELERHQAVILAKLHPKQTNIISASNNHSRILLFSQLANNPFSLYQYLADADGLITDYTSTYFDFLHRNKPVVFNFYDFDIYKQTRGFGFEPIELFCAGDIVKDAKSLVNAVKGVLNGEDGFKQIREKISTIFDAYYDGKNTQRVCEYFFH